MPNSVPNYITIDPVTGRVGADFSGHVHAAGIDLDANLDTLTSESEIIWRDADGVMVAQVYGTKGAGLDGRAQAVGMNSGGTGGVGGASLLAGTDSIMSKGRAWAEAYKPGIFKQATILDSDGRSDFVLSFAPPTAIGLINPPWSNIAGYLPAGYRKANSGLVTLSGFFQANGAYGFPINVAFGLPPAINAAGSAASMFFSVPNSNWGLTAVQIATNGVMSVTGGGAPSGAGWWLNLHGLSYYSTPS